MEGFEIIQTNQLEEAIERDIFELWNNEYPENISFPEPEYFNNYIYNLKNLKHFLIKDIQNYTYGWASTFERENETWFMILVSGQHQGKGIGKMILDTLKQKESILNGWVISHKHYRKLNGDKYISPINFYLKNDFEILNSEKLKSDKISAVKVRWIKKV